MRRPVLHGEDGNALVEFTYLALLLMIPFVYVLTTVFLLQRAAFAVTEAARQAARAYVQASTPDEGFAVAAAAAELAMGDQGLPPAGPPAIEASEGLSPGATVRVTVVHEVTLPLIGGLFGEVQPHIPVRATHVQVVDRFREAR